MKRLGPLLLLGMLAGCSSGSEPATTVVDAEVSWMAWPAEVVTGVPFTVRLTGYGVDCREIVDFSFAPSVDNSAVTFTPYFVVTTKQIVCPLLNATPSRLAADPMSPFAPNFDTVATVAGLAGQTARTYEMRAAANVSAPAGSSLPASVPVRTFGEILVRPAGADTSRLNAGGSVYTYRDTLGCLHISPPVIVFAAAGPPQVPPGGYVVENPPDTTSFWSGFVHGYLYKPAKALCGDSLVFHLVTRE